MSAVAAAMGILVRWPLGSPHWLVFVKAFLLLGATISAAILALARIERRGGSYALVLASTLTVLFLPCLAWLIGWAADLIVDPALLGLFAAGIVQIVAVRGHAPPGQVRPAISCGLFAGLGYFVLINSRGLANVLSPEEAIVGLSNLDTLFHASIANMLVKHGALSMGLDGFVPIVYHFLSHVWLGCLALWLATGTLHVYYIGAQVVAIPMLFFSLLLAVYSLRPAGQRLGNGALVVQFPLLLLLLTELQGWTSYLVSESYFLAIIIFLLALPLLSETARIENHRRLGLNAAGLAIAGILMALSKVSVGTVFLAASSFQVLRQLALRPMMFLKLTIPALLVAAVAAAFLFKDFGGTAKMYAPFSFVQDYPEVAWSNIVANLVLLCAAVAVWVSATSSDKRSSDKRCAEAFAVIAVAGSLPALLLAIPGGSAYYFVNIGTFAAIVFVAAYAGPFLVRHLPSLFRPELILAVIMLVILDTDQKTRSPSTFAGEFAELQERTRGYLGEGTPAAPVTWRRLVALLAPNNHVRRALASDVKRLPRAQSVETLLAAGLTQTADAAVFVPPENSTFWSSYRDCRAVSLFIPAVLGAPMLKGLNPTAPECHNEPNYGFPAYPPDAVSQASTDSELCARATKWGLRTVFVLATPVHVRKIECN
jgi:hypothetical protein